MHLLAADGLSCPRCGPKFPLILLADDVRDRRVFDGFLGCSNCRERYPVARGFGDLRPEPRMEGDEVSPLPEPTEDEVDRLAAALELAGQARALLLDDAARFAPELADRVPDASLWALSPHVAAWTEQPRVDRMRVGARLPFADWSMRGVVLEGADVAGRIPEAVRVLAPGHRLVVLDAPPGVGDTLLARGLKVGEPADGMVVGARGGAA